MLPDGLFGAVQHLGDFAAKLVEALDAHGYEHRFLAIPGSGFALVSQLERVDANGKSVPPPERFALGAVMANRSFASVLQAIFFAPEGSYRVIAFVVTDQDFGNSERRMTSGEAAELMRIGHNVLPPRLARQDVTPDTHCTALIYEFKGSGFDRLAELRLPGLWQARAHLERSGLWNSLRGQP